MNQISFPAEYAPMAEFISARKDRGYTISFMTIMAAAYARTTRKFPALNYFAKGNRIYEHEDVAVSMMVLRDTGDGTLAEAAIKVHAKATDTIEDIARQFDEKVRTARKPDAKNGTVDFARTLLRVPFIPQLVVWLIKLIDHIGIMPKIINEISPFHCSLFITNMMSIGLPKIYHHLYNFGTCSVFLGVGMPERSVVSSGGKSVRKLALPLGFVTDERICGGAAYAQGMRCFMHYLQKPELLEMTPEEEDAFELEQKLVDIRRAEANATEAVAAEAKRVEENLAEAKEA
jgi:hypothetical protein